MNMLHRFTGSISPVCDQYVQYLPAGVSAFHIPESASRPLVDFGVLNDNLIKGLTSCVKCISRFLIKVQMYLLIHHLKYNIEEYRTM
jgi:hypothetical protein